MRPSPNWLAISKSRNYKWREKFSTEEIQMLNARLGDLLSKLGYEVGN